MTRAETELYKRADRLYLEDSAAYNHVININTTVKNADILNL